MRGRRVFENGKKLQRLVTLKGFIPVSSELGVSEWASRWYGPTGPSVSLFTRDRVVSSWVSWSRLTSTLIYIYIIHTYNTLSAHSTKEITTFIL
mgnify:CR=1 FL=1